MQNSRPETKLDNTVLVLFLLLISCVAAQTLPDLDTILDRLASLNSETERRQFLERQTANPAALAKAIEDRAWQLSLRRDFRLAAELYPFARELAARAGDKKLQATSMANLALALDAMGEYERPVQLLMDAIAVAREAKERSTEASCEGKLAAVLRHQGLFAAATEHAERALLLYGELDDPGGRARTLNTLGNVYFETGNYRLGLKQFNEALTAAEKLGDKAGVAFVLNNIGNVYNAQRNFEASLEYYQRSYQIKQTISDQTQTANTLANIAGAYLGLGQFVLAEQHLKRSLALSEAAGAKRQIAEALVTLGELAAKRGDRSGAVSYLERASAVTPSTGDKRTESIALIDLAEVLFEEREFERARKLAVRGRALSAETGDLVTLQRAATIRGQIAEKVENAAAARAFYLEAVDAAEQVRAQSFDQERFFENRLQAYGGVVRLAARQGRTQEAFEYSERARARLLTGMLQTGRVLISKAMTEDERAEEQRLRSRLTVLNLRRQESASPSLRAQIDAARREYARFRTKLYAAHAELRMQRLGRPVVSARAAAAGLPGDRWAAVEFAVGERETVAMVIRKIGAPAAARLPLSKSRLETMTRRFREQLNTRDPAFTALAGELYAELFAPLLPKLSGISSIVIVPDGVLWQVPFQALRSPKQRYVIEDFSIAYAPSLTIFTELGKKSGRYMREPSLLAFASPLSGAPSLTDTAREVAGIAEIYGQRTLVRTGANADEGAFKSEAAKYSILHLAAHGVLDDRNPLYSYIALTHPDSDTREDGLLEAREMMDLNLRAQLVVLSACETARGGVREGEGLIGMTWALLIAGVPAIVGSQWRVDSNSTANLMISLHRILKRSWFDGVDAKAEVLRDATLSVMRTPGFEHPYYWAGFVLVGR